MNRHHALFPALALSAALGCKQEAPPAPPPPVAAAAEPVEEEKPQFATLTPDEVEARIKDVAAGKGKLAIFDANGPDRYARSHLPGARWVKFDEVKASDLPADKDTPLLFYCANEY